MTDAKGSWIVPGLVDAHVHFAQTGFGDGRPDAFDVRAAHPYEETQRELRTRPERFFRSYVCSGVTSVFDVGGYAWSLDLPARAENDSLAPRVAAAGPLLSTVDHWVTLPGERQFLLLKDAEAAKAGVAYLASRGAKAVKVWYLVRPDLPVTATAPAVLAAGDEAKKRGLPLIVHATGLAEAKVALKAGAKLLVHSVTDQPVDDEFLALAKANGTIYNPTLVVLDGYVAVAKGFSAHAPVAFDDPNGCVDPVTKARLAETARLELPTAVDLGRFEKRAGPARAIAAANLTTREGRRHSDRDGDGRRQPRDAPRAVGLRRDGGDAGGRDDTDGGSRRVHEGRRARDGSRRRRDAREGQAGGLPPRRSRPARRRREPAEAERRRPRRRLPDAGRAARDRRGREIELLRRCAAGSGPRGFRSAGAVTLLEFSFSLFFSSRGTRSSVAP